jgi:hypothetical protein
MGFEPENRKEIQLVISRKLPYIPNLEKVSRIGLRYIPHDFSAKDLEGDYDVELREDDFKRGEAMYTRSTS